MAKALILLLWSFFPLATCFSNPAITQYAPVLAVSSRTMLRLFENEQEEEEKIVGDGRDDASTIDSADLYSGLNHRKREIKRGVGKVCFAVLLYNCIFNHSIFITY